MANRQWSRMRDTCAFELGKCAVQQPIERERDAGSNCSRSSKLSADPPVCPSRRISCPRSKYRCSNPNRSVLCRASRTVRPWARTAAINPTNSPSWCVRSISDVPLSLPPPTRLGDHADSRVLAANGWTRITTQMACLDYPPAVHPRGAPHHGHTASDGNKRWPLMHMPESVGAASDPGAAPSGATTTFTEEFVVRAAPSSPPAEALSS